MVTRKLPDWPADSQISVLVASSDHSLSMLCISHYLAVAGVTWSLDPSSVELFAAFVTIHYYYSSMWPIARTVEPFVLPPGQEVFKLHPNALLYGQISTPFFL